MVLGLLARALRHLRHDCMNCGAGITAEVPTNRILMARLVS